jgi:hypothetical protein
MSENIWSKCPDKWYNSNWVLHHENALAHALLVMQQFLASTNASHPPPFLPTRPCPAIFRIPKDEIEAQGVTFESINVIQTVLHNVIKMLMQMTSRSPSD